MSHIDILKIPRTPDRLVVNAFRELVESYSLRLMASTAVSGVNLRSLPMNESDEKKEPWATLLGEEGALIRHLHISNGSFSIHFHRGGPDNKSAVYDEIRIQQGDGPPGLTETERLKAIALISHKLKAFDPNLVLPNIEEEARQFGAIHASTLTRLEQLAEDLIRRTSAVHQRLEEDYAVKKHGLDADFHQAKYNLAEKHEQELSKLKAQEDELARRYAEIDDRDNTHVRREMRDKMLEDVKTRIQQFGVSDNTARKRRPVSQGLLSLCAIFVCLIIWTIAEIYSQQKVYIKNFESLTAASTISQKELATNKSTILTPHQQLTAELDAARTMVYLLWARLSLFSIGLIGAILYYIRWENRWAEQHANAEFQLQQFYIDVNRANWVIESGLEWRKETSSEMPEVVLSSVTKNLFRAQDEAPPALHPADELASALLGSASKLKLKSGESEVEFDKPGKIPNR